VEAGHKALAERFPFWNDPAQRATVQNEIAKFGLTLGFTRDELRSLSDPRHIVVLTQAMLFQRMMARAGARPAASGDRAPVAGVRQASPLDHGGGAAPAPDVRRAEAQFSAKPDLRNAAALLGARRAQDNAR
jgi:hypothetical protein